MLIGTISIRNIASHGSTWSTRPPTIGPEAPPIETAVVWLPIAVPRSTGGNTETTIAVPTDCPIALPVAITTRATISSQNAGATAVKTAPAPKSASPVRWMRFQPTMSASRPIGIISALIVSACAITTQVTARSVIPKSSAIDDSATNTIDMLITCVTNAIPIAVNAFHL